MSDSFLNELLAGLEKMGGATSDLSIRFSSEFHREKYFADYEDGKWEVVAGTPLAAAYALSRLQMAKKSGHLRDYLGKQSPRFSKRALFPKCHKVCSITPQWKLAIPRWFTDKALIDLFCRRTIEMGYNTVVLGSIETEQYPEAALQRDHFLPFAHHELDLIIAPQGDTIDTIDELFDLPFDGLFWTARAKSDGNFTEEEVHLQEVKRIERMLDGVAELIYYIPASHDISPLCLVNDVSKNTVISFSSVNGLVDHNFLAPHPVWDQLRHVRDFSATSLLPLFNLGAMRLGEGLWPLFSFDMLRHFYNRMDNPPFGGMIGLVPTIPSKGSWLDANLWVAQEALWSHRDGEYLLETWLKCHRPQWNFFQLLTIHQSTLAIAIGLQKMGLQKKALTNLIVQQLHELASLEISDPELKFLVSCFIGDAVRLIEYYSKRDKFLVPKLPDGDKRSFWTTPQKEGLLEMPQAGELGSLQEKILKANHSL